MPVQSAILFETIEEIYERVFRDLRPTLNIPDISVKFHRFTNLTSNIRLVQGQLIVKISDLLEGAPSPVQESLAYILLSKLFRQRPPKGMVEMYRLYLSRAEVRGKLNEVRQQRGRKLLTEPTGHHFDLEAMFVALNQKYFDGTLAKPLLGWSLQASRTILGHYDASHHSITLSRRLDRAEVPEYVVAYVLYHEMLHIKHPVEHHGAARKIHTRGFKQEEKLFEQYVEAKAFLKKGWR
jgi:hypothetical protein